MILPALTSRPSASDKHERVERQQQPVVFGELVEEGEPDRNELGWLASTFGGHALDGVKSRLHVPGLYRQIKRQPPLGGFEVFSRRWSNHDLCLWQSCHQTLCCLSPVGVILLRTHSA